MRTYAFEDNSAETMGNEYDGPLSCLEGVSTLMSTTCSSSDSTHLCPYSEIRQFRCQGFPMSEQRLATQLLFISRICVVAVGQNPSLRNHARKKIPQPENFILGSPRLLTVTIQSVNCNNTWTMASVLGD